MLALRVRSRAVAAVRPWRLQQCRSIVAAPGSPWNRPRKEAEDQAEAPSPAAAKETEMTETFNIDPSEPWKGLPDFISFTNRVLACGIDLSLCESWTLRCVRQRGADHGVTLDARHTGQRTDW
eukprot:COSAG02_NODE_11422_length_1727_cov_2.847666_1_plen_123_part_00